MKVFLAGHRGMVGSAIKEELSNFDGIEVIGKSSKELDLRNQLAVREFIESEKPDAIIDAAARVGGILANNNYPYNFLMDNLLIQNNLISEAVNAGIKKFVFLGSSCIYPRLADQPLKEEYLLNGPLEPTNEWYAIAKIAGVKACQAIRKQFNLGYISLMPTNLYGPNDNFDLQTSHVLPALIRKFHEAKVNGSEEVILWGSGSPLREFLHVHDLAKAVRYALLNEMPEHLYNVGSSVEISIKDLALLIQKTTGFEGKIVWDSEKPDGTPRKLMDSGKLNSLGWNAEIELEPGIQKTYSWFLENIKSFKEVKL